MMNVVGIRVKSSSTDDGSTFIGLSYLSTLIIGVTCYVWSHFSSGSRAFSLQTLIIVLRFTFCYPVSLS